MNPAGFSAFTEKAVPLSLKKKQRGISICRWVAPVQYRGKKADQEDLAKVHAWLSAHDPELSLTRNSRSNGFVVKKRERIIGYVQLVRYPEGSYPFVGYWLFSLGVKTLVVVR